MSIDPRAQPLLPLLRALVKHHGSDLHLKTGSQPRIRINGNLYALSVPAMTAKQCEDLVLATMDEGTRTRFAQTNEADYAIHPDDIGRFRINAYRTMGRVGLVARLVADHPPTLDALGLPPALGTLAQHHRGLVLVTGPTGSGKTTTLAGLVDRINEQRNAHILTIEDPIEIVHTDKQASISQRELGTDTYDYSAALRSAMRQDPDVILIGEMRDTDTVRAAIQAAETGHLVLSTLHTTDATETVHRIIDFFAPHEQKQIRLSLSQSLKGVVCQRLVLTADGRGRLVVTEILINTDRVAEAIADPAKTATIAALLADGAYYGMQTFDQHLVQLVREQRITVAAALAASTRPHDLTVALKRAGIPQALIDAAKDAPS